MTDREKTTELFLEAQGYDEERIFKAIACLSGSQEEIDDRILTPKELCSHLKISMTTLWRLDPPHIAIGARKRYRLAEVEDFLSKISSQPSISDE